VGLRAPIGCVWFCGSGFPTVLETGLEGTGTPSLIELEGNEETELIAVDAGRFWVRVSPAVCTELIRACAKFADDGWEELVDASMVICTVYSFGFVCVTECKTNLEVLIFNNCAIFDKILDMKLLETCATFSNTS